ncbi:4-carboxymuconolactone decarboxylase [Ancylobacter sp. 3268]|uniref:carboxymuconolactone decarboxylase family protein n=1 Tax=Ancylobacter sp. 3268 TaxID=2817752 RepID=UPI00285D02DC|nr:carboxymuconolactone decarboxylase family protein [Ancylobacter sp. 3268]MDR6955443.1 4-carboxymuconolactone decarboxylase [Ancylobacter sp. 3268]
MLSNPERLGGRLPLLDPAALQGEQRELYRTLSDTLVTWAQSNGFRGATDDGRLIGPFNPYLYSPGITPGFLKWMQADGHHTSLSKPVHEIVILTVGALWHSPYELYAHAAVARTVGVPERVIEDLVAGRTPDGLSDQGLLAHRFARQLTEERRVDEVLYRDAEAAFGPKGLVDLVYLVGMYLLTCALLNAFEIPAPE